MTTPFEPSDDTIKPPSAPVRESSYLSDQFWSALQCQTLEPVKEYEDDEDEDSTDDVSSEQIDFPALEMCQKSTSTPVFDLRGLASTPRNPYHPPDDYRTEESSTMMLLNAQLLQPRDRARSPPPVIRIHPAPERLEDAPIVPSWRRRKVQLSDPHATRTAAPNVPSILTTPTTYIASAPSVPSWRKHEGPAGSSEDPEHAHHGSQRLTPGDSLLALTAPKLVKSHDIDEAECSTPITPFEIDGEEDTQILNSELFASVMEVDEPMPISTMARVNYEQDGEYSSHTLATRPEMKPPVDELQKPLSRQHGSLGYKVNAPKVWEQSAVEVHPSSWI